MNEAGIAALGADLFRRQLGVVDEAAGVALAERDVAGGVLIEQGVVEQDAARRDRRRMRHQRHFAEPARALVGVEHLVQHLRPGAGGGLDDPPALHHRDPVRPVRGDAEIMGEVFGAFGTAMGAGVMLVYVVLVLLFHNFVTPISILLSLPLAIGGAILALYIFDFAIGMPVVIGFLMLMGIVTKNAIMLVEFALQAMADNVPKREAILDAVHKRARPIIMTTIATTATAAKCHGAIWTRCAATMPSVHRQGCACRCRPHTRAPVA